MARRLTAAGMRPINNVVDVSNYVMLELNQPNHAYDLDTLGGGGFRIRLAADGETMTTLDGVERVFTADDLLICDGNDADRHRRHHGRARQRDQRRAPRRSRSRWPGSSRLAIAATVARLGLRSEASSRSSVASIPMACRLPSPGSSSCSASTCPDLVIHAGMVDAPVEAPAGGRR